MEAPQKIPQGKVKILDIKDVKWDRRYREDKGDLKALSDSIKEKGVLQPITVDTQLTLLAGERRITAATMAGLTKIPALVRETEGEIDAREVELFENVMRKDFSWAEEARLIHDIDALYKAKDIEWSGRKTAQLLDKGVATVARAIQLSKALETIPELGDMKTADEALKTVKNLEEQAIVEELRSRQQTRIEKDSSGDGVEATLRLADQCYRIGDVFKGLVELPSNGKFGLIECDPPYGIELGDVRKGNASVGNSVQTYEEVPTAQYQNFLDRLARELYRVANPNCWLIFWYGPTWHTQVMKALRDAEWTVDDIPGIWVKSVGQTMQPELYLGRAYEPFFIARKGKPLIMKRGRLNTFLYNGVSANAKYHPTERPVELIEDLLETFGAPGVKCLVPFLGSGATIRAAFNLGLHATGWDLNAEYKDRFMLKVEGDARALLQDSGD